MSGVIDASVKLAIEEMVTRMARDANVKNHSCLFPVLYYINQRFCTNDLSRSPENKECIAEIDLLSSIAPFHLLDK